MQHAHHTFRETINIARWRDAEIAVVYTLYHFPPVNLTSYGPTKSHYFLLFILWTIQCLRWLFFVWVWVFDGSYRRYHYSEQWVYFGLFTLREKKNKHWFQVWKALGYCNLGQIVNIETALEVVAWQKCSLRDEVSRNMDVLKLNQSDKGSIGYILE